MIVHCRWRNRLHPSVPRVRGVLAVVATCVVAAFAGSLAARGQAIPAQRASINVQEATLDNGLRILVVEDHRVPRVAAAIWIRIGALQEDLGEHGSTHFLEHIIHQGTSTVGTTNFAAERAILEEIHRTEQQLIAERNRDRNLLRERRIFFDELEWPTTPKVTELRQRLYALEDQLHQYREYWAEYLWYRRNGALPRHTDPVPATTGNESMDMDLDLPKERIELFFRLEADRLVNAIFRGWEAQRFTVLEQILNRQARPETGRFFEALDGASGIAHPIHLSPGGHLRDYAFYTRAAMMRMYDDYFVPNNATVTLVGAITLEEARTLAERYFGRVPRGPEPPSMMDVEAEPPPGGSVRLDWMEPLEPRAIVRYGIPGVGHPDRPAFDVIAALLSGKHGMLMSRLRAVSPAKGGIQATLHASAARTGSPGTLTLQARAVRDEDVPLLENVLLEVIDDLRAGRIDPGALRRGRKSLQLEWARVIADRDELGSQLGRFDVIDTWKTLPALVEARRSTTPAQIQELAQRYLVPTNRIVATSRRRPLGAAKPTQLTARPSVSTVPGDRVSRRSAASGDTRPSR